MVTITEPVEKVLVYKRNISASIATLPTPLGCALGGLLMETIGRKTIHMVVCIPCLVGWVLLYFSTTTTHLLIGRFTTGICLGILGPPSGVYTAETSDPEFRGFLLGAISFAITLGEFGLQILFSHRYLCNFRSCACSHLRNLHQLAKYSTDSLRFPCSLSTVHDRRP